MRRLHCDTAIWHVFARGSRRMELFRKEPDFMKFLDLLAFGRRASQCSLWAYALMSNHYHRVVEGSSTALAKCMHRLNGMYSSFHNQKYGLEGHAFDGPYHAFRQKT